MKPGVYARVPHFVDWIERTAQEECLFDAFETAYPDRFQMVPGQDISTTLEAADVRFRSYPVTGTTLAGFQSNILYLGPASDFQWTVWGARDELAEAYGCPSF
jgi:hypothetical protein